MMAVIIDEVITEVDTPVKSQTTTEKNNGGSENSQSIENTLDESLRRAEQRKLRLSAV